MLTRKPKKKAAKWSPSLEGVDLNVSPNFFVMFIFWSPSLEGVDLNISAPPNVTDGTVVTLA